MIFQMNCDGKPVDFPVALLKLQVPGARYPVAVRPDTSDMGTLVQTYLHRDYELTLPKPPKLIIDAGANVGYVSALFATQFPDAHIISIEPMPENFAVLSENARPYPNIHAVNAAVWSHPGTIDLVTHDQNNNFLGHWGVQVAETHNPRNAPVRALTISELIESTNFTAVDILKIDIEGAETEIFSHPDAGKWIEKTNMLIIELHDRFKPGCSQIVHNAMRAYGFMEFTRAENTFFVRTKPLPTSVNSTDARVAIHA